MREIEARKRVVALVKIHGTRGLAEIANVSPSLVSLVVNGKRPVGPSIARGLGWVASPTWTYTIPGSPR